MGFFNGLYRFTLSNPHLTLAFMLFGSGAALAFTELSTLAGAMIGGGATLLGSWISDFNTQRQEIKKKKEQEQDAKMFAQPELYRTIEKLLTIHSRALVNYNNWLEADLHKRNNIITDTGDIKNDFIPILPALYPNFEYIKHLPSKELFCLISYYDSLNELKDAALRPWDREGELKSNTFNWILQNAHSSLQQALNCIELFDLDNSTIQKHSGSKPLKKRIEHENEKYTQQMKRFEKAITSKKNS